MGIFGKIKNILFEPDEEEIIEDMPIYTKEDVKEVPKRDEVVVPKVVEEPPVKPTSTSHFSNVKRDIDIDYETENVLGEVPGAKEALTKAQEAQAQVVPKVEVEERPSPFQSFDEKEFERVNPRTVKNDAENKVKKEQKEQQRPSELEQVLNNYRKSNNLFSSTNSNKEIKTENTNSEVPTKKPFTPSPVISPVYGILDKNYHKDDIVDRQGGMKREKVVKPAVKEEVLEVPEPVIEKHVDIDSVRKKAYGTLETLDEEMPDISTDTIIDAENVIENITPNVIDTPIEELNNDYHEDEIKETNDYLEEAPIDNLDIEEEIDDDVTLGDLINKQKEVSNIVVDDDYEETVEEVEEEVPSIGVKDRIEESMVEKEEEPQEEIVKPRLLDDMEKTSTLQILDDIEKELNSIKPISKDVKTYDDEDMKEKIENNETLENDLFNLIDSMYEQGEED